jgi:hypothetical protein
MRQLLTAFGGLGVSKRFLNIVLIGASRVVFTIRRTRQTPPCSTTYLQKIKSKTGVLFVRYPTRMKAVRRLMTVQKKGREREHI